MKLKQLLSLVLLSSVGAIVAVNAVDRTFAPEKVKLFDHTNLHHGHYHKHTADQKSKGNLPKNRQHRNGKPFDSKYIVHKDLQYIQFGDQK